MTASRHYSLLFLASGPGFTASTCLALISSFTLSCSGRTAFTTLDYSVALILHRDVEKDLLLERIVNL